VAAAKNMLCPLNRLMMTGQFVQIASTSDGRPITLTPALPSGRCNAKASSFFLVGNDTDIKIGKF
jgi:hypothetical protein